MSAFFLNYNAFYYTILLMKFTVILPLPANVEVEVCMAFTNNPLKNNSFTKKTIIAM